MQVVASTNDAYGRVLYEAGACITIMLSGVAQAVKSSSQTSDPEMLNETIKKILDHAMTTGLVDHLCLCLKTPGSLGSPVMLQAASEACRAICSMINALDTLFLKTNAIIFPIDALQSHSLSRIEITDHEQSPFIGSESSKVVEAVTRAFLNTKATRVAFYYCFHQCLEAAICSGLQVPVALCFILCSQGFFL